LDKFGQTKIMRPQKYLISYGYAFNSRIICLVACFVTQILISTQSQLSQYAKMLLS